MWQPAFSATHCNLLCIKKIYENCSESVRPIYPADSHNFF